MKQVRIGLVGSGFVADIHAHAYARVYGYDARITALYSTNRQAREFAARHGIATVYSSLDELLACRDVDVIDICTPPHAHIELIKKAMSAGKHVMCEKPLTGFFGLPQAVAGERAGDVDRGIMYAQVMEAMDDLRTFLASTDRQFFYAENFVYAPAVQKSRELLQATGNKILLMKGEESHSGSHAAHAAEWKYSGGGSFMRQGCHPLSAILYLKQVEAAARGERISVASVTGDMGNTLRSVAANELQHVAARPVDVEDCANVILTFSDGTKANLVSCDMVLGGVRNLIEVYTTGGVHLCNMAPNDQMRIYHPTDAGLASVYVTEKVETKIGWQDVYLEEELARGYIGELHNFMECMDTGAQPQSGFELAYETTRVVYGAYLSDARGARVEL